MTPDTCVTFFDACASGKGHHNQLAGPRDSSIRAMFDTYEYFKDKITLEGFLNFYRDAASHSAKRNTVWENLEAHGIGIDLHPDPKTDHDYKNDDNVTRDQSILPRCQIANNPELLEVLFKLDEKLDTGTSDQIWDLIASLKTNRQLYMSILTNDE